MATLTITELATELDSTPRDVRKFLRSVTPADEQPGKGHRWQIEKRAVRGLKKQFAEHTAKPTKDNQEAEHDADLVTTDA